MDTFKNHYKHIFYVSELTFYLITRFYTFIIIEDALNGLKFSAVFIRFRLKISRKSIYYYKRRKFLIKRSSSRRSGIYFAGFSSGIYIGNILPTRDVLYYQKKKRERKNILNNLKKQARIYRNAENSCKNRISLRSTDVAAFSPDGALENKHQVVSYLAPLSLNNLQTGYGADPSGESACFPVSLRAIGHQSSE